MLLAPLFALMLLASPGLSSGSPSPVTDTAPEVVWAASSIVSADGALHVLPGWRVRVGPAGRASLAGPQPRTPQPRGSWDDDVTVGDVHVAVRVTAQTPDVTYVEGRLHRGDLSRAFVLRWDPGTGHWSDAVASL